MTIYFTMTLGVVLIELMHINRAKYDSKEAWLKDRWDNLAVSFISGVALCFVFPEFTLFLENSFNIGFDLHSYPALGGLVFGLSATPIINKIKSVTKDRIEKAN